MISGHAALAIRNADLSFRTAEFARATRAAAEAPAEFDVTVEQAIGVLIQQQGLTARQARQKLHSAALHAGVEVAAFARGLLALATPE